jgi:hypothetical protein
MSGLKLSHEVADEIIRLGLIDHYNHLQEELDAHLENSEENWMHPEDVGNSYKLIRAMETIIDYYGGFHGE